MSAIAKAAAFKPEFSVYDSTTGLIKSGATLTVTVSKDGGAFSASTNSAAEVGSTGVYTIQLTSTEMDADVVCLKITGTGVLTKTITITTDTLSARIPAALVSSKMDSNVSAIDATLDTYQAKVWLTDDNGGSTDRYVVAFFKNSQPFRTGGGITSPTIQVIKATDGTDLIATAALTEIGTSEIYKYDATTTERITDGAAYAVIVTATIGGSSREWVEVLNSRDS